MHWAAALVFSTHLTLVYVHRPGTARCAEFQRSHKKSIRPVRFLVWTSLYCTVCQDSVLYSVLTHPCYVICSERVVSPQFPDQFRHRSWWFLFVTHTEGPQSQREEKRGDGERERESVCVCVLCVNECMTEERKERRSTERKKKPKCLKKAPMHLKAPTLRRSFNPSQKTNTKTSRRTQIQTRFHTSNPHQSAARPRTLTGTTPRAPTKVTLVLIHILPSLPLPRARLARLSRAILLTNL